MKNKSIHTFVVLAYKESSYLEFCIQSVKNQKYPSEVLIATSTPNLYIKELAEKYNIEIIINNGEKGIGADFDFARTCAKTKLVTCAHQDDIYDYEYSSNIVEAFYKEPSAIILFSDYYELKNDIKEINNTNLKIKRMLLTLLKFKGWSGFKGIKRSCLSLGNAICCPAVTFVNQNITINNVFKCDFVCDVDWYAWEKLSKLKGKFIFVNKNLMGHRVHEESTTTEIIQNKIRTKEDLIMFQKFWPSSIAKLLNHFYVKSESNNKV